MLYRPRLADDDLPPSFENNQQVETHSTQFDLGKLKDPSVLETFQAVTGGKFAPLTIMNNEDADMDSIITTFNTVVTETAGDILGKHRQKTKPWNTENILDLCDKKGN